MENFTDILNRPLIASEAINISIYHIIIILMILLVTIFSLSLVKQLFNRLVKLNKINHDSGTSFYVVTKYIVWIIVVTVCLNIIGFRLADILSYRLIVSKSININAYHIIIILVILLATIFSLRIVKRVFQRLIKLKKIDHGSGTSFYLIVKYIAWVIVITVCLDTIGVKLTLLIASSAALLVGFGLGIQQIFHDIASGIILLFERNLKVNDIIELQNNIIGKVQEIGLRTSKILTRDNIIMIIPNSKLISDNVINWSHNEQTTRFNVDIGVAYGSDVLLVKKILLDIAENHPDISHKRKAFVRFNNFGDSSLDFSLFFWSDKSFAVEFIKSDVRFAINKEFAENNITIPFPQRDVHIKPAKDAL